MSDKPKKTRAQYSKLEIYKYESLPKLLEFLELHPDLELFRGQADAKWQLVPKLSRVFTTDEIPDTWNQLERSILSDFQKYAEPHLGRMPSSKFEWLVMGQHYGLPTRLLDWTTNPLKALFFAINEHPDIDGALFGFSPCSWISRLDRSESIDNFKRAIPVYPDMIDRRVVVQEACFTVLPFPEDHKPFIPLEDCVRYDGDYFLMVKIVIPASLKSTVLRQINLLGVNSMALFPDLSGIADFVSWRIRNGIC